MAKEKIIDVLVIGGGINGVGIARDLAGRGLGVVLCEKNDLASATSSASTKLIHGGLRYLEQYRFRMVRDSLAERETLMRLAPHLIRPMTFVLPHHRGLRPAWLIRLGLFLYDHLGGRTSLPRSRGLHFAGTAFGQPLKFEFRRGFHYADGWADDARLTVLNAVDAHDRGARVLTRVACTALTAQGDGGWSARLADTVTGEETDIRVRLVVNATGPWVEQTRALAPVGADAPAHRLRWVKGSHIILPRLYHGDHAYLLQNDDRRVVFAIPYEERYTLVGTTDVEYSGSLEEVRIDMDEVEYLCAAVNAYFRQPIRPEQVEWTYSGVRPLLDDGLGNAAEVTRDYRLELDDSSGAPMLNVYGGKLTAFRKLAEQAADRVVAQLKKGKGPWTAEAPLPGGEGAGATFEVFFKTFRREYNWLPEPLAERYARAYGTRARVFLRGAKKMQDLGEHFGDGVYEAEIAYMTGHEWARALDDVLWRRSKLGLHVSDATADNINRALPRLLAARTA